MICSNFLVMRRMQETERHTEHCRMSSGGGSEGRKQVCKQNKKSSAQACRSSWLGTIMSDPGGLNQDK